MVHRLLRLWTRFEEPYAEFLRVRAAISFQTLFPIRRKNRPRSQSAARSFSLFTLFSGAAKQFIRQKNGSKEVGHERGPYRRPLGSFTENFD
jgi:hypothetical protein